MYKFSKNSFFFLLFLVLLLLGSVGLTLADDSSSDLNEINRQIQEYQGKLKELGEAKKTLNNQISYMNYQIRLTTLKIRQTEESVALLEKQIEELSGRINKLDASLNKLSVVFLDKVITSYKSARVDPLWLFLSSNGFADFYRRWKYLRVVQLNDRRTLLALEQARANYDLVKQEKKEKQQQLEALKKQLDNQKAALVRQRKDKEYLLAVTKNNEKKYQQLLSQALAELEAIQQAVAGKGRETKVGQVKAGEQIATIIVGSSPCSSGTHLHFEVQQGGSHKNPANFLKPISLNYDYDTSKIAEFINPTGSWDWPLNPPIYVHQIYGETTWIRILGLHYKFHTGIDISSDDLMVKSVADGTLYNGSIKCGGGYLRYVRVKHQDSDISTYYLHVNYFKL
jgi:peptidoglycan hydrolase CwlO-like protein